MVLLLVLTLVVLTVAAFAAGYALALRRRRETGTDALRQLRDGTSAAEPRRGRKQGGTSAAEPRRGRNQGGSSEAEPGPGRDAPPSGTGGSSTALALRGHTAIEPVRVAFMPDAAEGTADWQRAMREVGAQMRSAGVRLVVFAHGSFVGDDPLAIARVLEEALPMLPDLGRAVRGFTRVQISRVLGDLSNFPREYIEAFSN